MILLIFGLLRYFRERGRENEATEVTKALRTRLHKGERLLSFTIGDRRPLKPLATLTDFALMMFTQGLAAEGSGAMATDDTYLALTNRRLIAIDRWKRPTGRQRGWLERLNLRRSSLGQGRHAMLFEAPREAVSVSVRLAAFHLARLVVRGPDGKKLSLGINSRYWAERAAALSESLSGAAGQSSRSSQRNAAGDG
jgi:hypothetical protein